MTDQEIICTFMEPKPAFRETLGRRRSQFGWWEFHHAEGRPDCYVCPRVLLSLDALWEVEERLTDSQWVGYDFELVNGPPQITNDETFNARKRRIHATPEQKIKALASILRPLVEKES